MPSCFTLLLLMSLSLKMVGSKTEEHVPCSEDAPWLISRLKEGEYPDILLQQLVQESKRGKTGQFYGLMGKRTRGKSLIQSVQHKALSVDQEEKDQVSEWEP